MAQPLAQARSKLNKKRYQLRSIYHRNLRKKLDDADTDEKADVVGLQNSNSKNDIPKKVQETEATSSDKTLEDSQGQSAADAVGNKKDELETTESDAAGKQKDQSSTTSEKDPKGEPNQKADNIPAESKEPDNNKDKNYSKDSIASEGGTPVAKEPNAFSSETKDVDETNAADSKKESDSKGKDSDMSSKPDDISEEQTSNDGEAASKGSEATPKEAEVEPKSGPGTSTSESKTVVDKKGDVANSNGIQGGSNDLESNADESENISEGPGPKSEPASDASPSNSKNSVGKETDASDIEDNSGGVTSKPDDVSQETVPKSEVSGSESKQGKGKGSESDEAQGEIEEDGSGPEKSKKKDNENIEDINIDTESPSKSESVPKDEPDKAVEEPKGESGNNAESLHNAESNNPPGQHEEESVVSDGSGADGATKSESVVENKPLPSSHDTDSDLTKKDKDKSSKPADTAKNKPVTAASPDSPSVGPQEKDGVDISENGEESSEPESKIDVPSPDADGTGSDVNSPSDAAKDKDGKPRDKEAINAQGTPASPEVSEGANGATKDMSDEDGLRKPSINQKKETPGTEPNAEGTTSSDIDDKATDVKGESGNAKNNPAPPGPNDLPATPKVAGSEINDKDNAPSKNTQIPPPDAAPSIPPSLPIRTPESPELPSSPSLHLAARAGILGIALICMAALVIWKRRRTNHASNGYQRIP